jgi:hypothetical protein
MPAAENDAEAPGRLALVAAALRRAGRMALDLALPPQCLACSKPVTETGALCVACWGDLKLIERPYCERLGTPFAAERLGTELEEAFLDGIGDGLHVALVPTGCEQEHVRELQRPGHVESDEVLGLLGVGRECCGLHEFRCARGGGHGFLPVVEPTDSRFA